MDRDAAREARAALAAAGEARARGDVRDALVAFREVATRFRGDPDPFVRACVASALCSAGRLQAAGAGSATESLQTFEELVSAFSGDSDPLLREYMAGARSGIGYALIRLGRFADAIREADGLYEMSVKWDDFERADAQTLALDVKADALSRLNRRQEALVATDAMLAAMAGLNAEPGWELLEVGSMVRQVDLLLSLGRVSVAATAATVMASKVVVLPLHTLASDFAEELLALGQRLSIEGADEAAVALLMAIETVMRGASDPALRRVAALAKHAASGGLFKLGRTVEGTDCFQSALAEYGQELLDAFDALILVNRDEPSVALAATLANKATVLTNLGRDDAAREVYAEILARFDESAEPFARQLVATARDAVTP